MEYKIHEVIEKNEDGKESIKWYYSFTDKITGRLKKLVCKKCYTKEEALLFVKNISKKTNEVYIIQNITKDMFIKNCPHIKRLELHGKKLTEKTLSQYRKMTEYFTLHFGHRNILTLSAKEIENFLLRDNIHSGSWKNLMLEIIRKIYMEAQWKCNKNIVMPLVNRFNRNTKKADIFTTEELEELFKQDNWPSYDIYLFFYIIASCGLRLGEARGLQVNQFDFTKNILIINGFINAQGKRTKWNKKGSAVNSKIRIVPLPKKIAKLLEKYIEAKKIKDDDFIFTTASGHYLDGKRMEEIFKKVLLKCKIDCSQRKLVPHSLRYTYVTRMRRTLNIELVQKLAGHTSPVMTEYYTRSNIDELISSIQGTFEAAENLFK